MPSTSPLPHVYDPTQERWLPGSRPTNLRARRGRMRVLSWDVWIGELERRKRDVASDTTGETLEGYGAALLARLPVIELVLEPLPSRMGRAMLAAARDFG